jgi:hypothetical protein
MTQIKVNYTYARVLSSVIECNLIIRTEMNHMNNDIMRIRAKMRGIIP